MENTKITDNAQTLTGEECLTDISGVKNDIPSHPDEKCNFSGCDADSCKSSVTSVIENGSNDGSATAEKELEAEFDALINGKFSGVYKKRTESIIRKRLRSVKPVQAAVVDKAHPADASKDSSEKETDLEKTSAPQNDGLQAEHKQSAIAYEQARAQNKSRPLENGLHGSCGMVTKINVSALDGNGVLAILRRVGAGEKISFK